MSTVEGWKTEQLGSLIKDIGDGGTPNTNRKEYFGGSIPWVVIQDIRKSISTTKTTLTHLGLASCSAKVWPAGSVILSTGATIGEVGLAEVPVATKQGIHGIVCKEELSSQYLYYKLQLLRDFLKANAQGSTIREVRAGFLKTIPIFFPSTLSEQTKIEEILSTVDRAIEQTEALIAKQQRIKTGLMQDLLTRGIDEHGNLRSEQTHKFKDSPLGRIPVEWAVVMLSHYIIFIRSGLSRRLLENDIGVPVITSMNVQQSLLDTTHLSYWYLKDPQGAKTETYYLDDGDILLNFINSIDQIGKACMFEDIGRPAIYTTNLFRIKARQVSSQAFLFHLLDSHIVQNEIKLITKPAVNQASFTTGDFLSITVPLISYDEQLRIVEFLSALNNNQQGAVLSLAKLNREKTALMQDLLTGKKRVTALLQDAEGLSS